MDGSSRPVVLNTRPARQAEALSQLLRSAGYEPLEAPAVVVVPAADHPAAHEAARALAAGEVDWLVLPSANAARLLLGLFVSAGSAVHPRTRILCGTATAEAVRSFGVEPSQTLDRFSATAALEVLRADDALGQVLLARAAMGRDELSQGLRADGVPLREVVLYRTDLAPPETLRVAAERCAAGAVAAVTFTSSSTVRGLVAGFEALGYDLTATLGGCALVAIGATTAAALHELGLRADAVAAETSLTALVRAVGEALTPA